MNIAVDFDGTIVEHEYPKIGKPIPFAFDVLKKLQREEGHTLILWTVREGNLLQEAIDYCEQNGLTFYAANRNHPDERRGDAPRKLTADLFIDDRNIGGLIDWGIIYRIIKSGRNHLSESDMFLDEQSNRSSKKKNILIRIGEAWERAKNSYNY